MGIFSRISTLFKANVNYALDKAEEPEKILNQLLIDMNQQLVEAKQKVAASIADEKRLYKEHTASAEQAQQWEQKATLAVQKERDDLAREALSRRNEYQGLATEYKVQWEKQKQAVEQLKVHLRDLQRRIEEANRKKNLLIARQKRAKAQKLIHETMASMQDSGAFNTFERMERKVDDMEARADAAAEMADLDETKKLEDEFAKLETKTTVDDDLAALKAKLGQATKPEEVKADV